MTKFEMTRCVVVAVMFAGVLGLVSGVRAAVIDTPPLFVEVNPVPGSAAPGCEETLETCFTPNPAVVAVGGEVIFRNTDTAAHTFTSGTLETGLDGHFDTGLLLEDNSFTVRFDQVGEFPYFDLVHPWATGVIRVVEIPEPGVATCLLLAGLGLFRRCGRGRGAVVGAS